MAAPAVASIPPYMASGELCSLRTNLGKRIRRSAVLARLMVFWMRPNRRSALPKPRGSKGGKGRCGWACQSCWSSSNRATGHLRHEIFQRLLDAGNLHPHIIDGDAGDLRNLLVAEAFQQQGDDDPVLTGQARDGLPKGPQPLFLFKPLMRTAAGIGQFRELFPAPPLLAENQRGVHGDAIYPRTDASLPAKRRKAVPDVGHDFL